VALEALGGELTLAELTSKYDVHPTMIAAWKRQGKIGMSATPMSLFDVHPMEPPAVHLMESPRAD